MSTKLPASYTGDSVVLRMNTYDTDGATPIDPASCACTIYNAETGATIISGSGTVGTGYAQYVWSNATPAGRYVGVLSATYSSGVVVSESFEFELRSKPPTFTTSLDDPIGQVRFALGDDRQDAGVLPDDTNFTDEQIIYTLNRNGQNVFAACAELAAYAAQRWVLVPDMITTDNGALTIDRRQRIAHWQAMQAKYEALKRGGGNAGTVVIDRRDAWSVAAESGGDELIRREDTTYTDEER